ncbi:MAG: hormogonium polysaccharide secretion pseudopilin HpsC [Cyanobacteria bacterium SBLK]|nr:hormogonium polysaccharide secretion pseudopilin HpsC [Cyanobacteria bacterium SBLK]
MKFFLLTGLASRKINKSTCGYTLIELLVAMIIAALVISPILGLAVNLLQTDRQEQAKATSEEEIQLAADFIARDLKQAVYIYDADALEANGTNDAATSGIQNQIPPGSGTLGTKCTDVNTCQPILVFWKRRPVTSVIPLTTPWNCNNPNQCDDTFVFSLVAYYLIKNNGANNVWSNTARIARFEIKNGVVAPANATSTVRVNNVNYMQVGTKDHIPSDGFQMFDLSLSGTLAGKMNRWTKGTGNYDSDDMQILVDYIDQTPANSPNPNTPPAMQSCPVDTLDGQALRGDRSNAVWTQSVIPADFPNSFYACVNSRDTAAIIYLRGNAIARIQSETTPPTYTENRGRAGYFPSIKTEVQSVGRLIQ